MNTEAISLATTRAAIQSSDFAKKSVSTFEWLFIVFGGLPLCLPFLFLLGENGLSSQNPIYWYVLINSVVSSPHVYSTYLRLGRKISENKASFFIGWPSYAVLLLILQVAQFKGLFVEAMTAVNVVQSYHYLRQVYGTYRLYSGASNENALARNLSVYVFHLAMPLFIFGRWDMLYTVWGGKPSSAIIPVDFSNTFMNCCWVLAGIAIILAFVLEYVKIKHSYNTYNPVGAVIIFVYFVIHWFGFLSVQFYQRGFFAITIFHAVQYFALLWFMERQSESGRSIIAKFQNVPFKVLLPLIWLLVFVSVYIWENKVLTFGNLFFANTSMLIMGAVSAHHYFVDAFIWRRQAGK